MVLFCLYVGIVPACAAKHLTMQPLRMVKTDTALCQPFGDIRLPDTLNGSRLAADAPWHAKRHPWRSAAEVVGINAAFLAFDYYVLKASFAQVTSRTLRRNFSLQHWFWDSDEFHTNLLYHPYHGNLFFGAARSNGMNFWQSVPFAVGGDLLWELAGESELPSINDALSTGIGGLAVGEAAFRLSNLVYDDSQRGIARVARELLGAAISPGRGLDRLLSGKAWRVRHDYNRYHDYDRFPARVAFSAGHRYVASDDEKTGCFHTPYLDVKVLYGDAFGGENRPYDYFTAEAGVVVGNQQKPVNHLRVMGQLYATAVNDSNRMKTRFGLYQHFSYDNATGVNGGKSPYQLSEAASVGIGFMCRIPDICRVATLQQSFFLNGMLLGGTWSDYRDNRYARSYNMGSGFTAKANTLLQVANRMALSVDAYFFRMFTWRGHEDVAPDTPGDYYSAQGNRGHTSVWVIRPQLRVAAWRQWGIHLSGAYYDRHSHYTYKPDARSRTYELRLGLLYHLGL